ncbi:MAG: sensor domain-containing diguanylate cyclase [Alkalispirochaeta sp.]
MDSTTSDGTFDDLVRLSHFSEMARDLAEARSLNDTLRRIMQHIGTIFAPTHWSLLLKNHTTGELRFVVVEGGSSAALKDQVIPKGQGIAGWIAEHGLPVINEDVTRDERFDGSFDQLADFETRSIIGVPLKTSTEVFGVIELVNTLENRSFTPLELKFLTAIGEFGAIAIERAYYFSALRRSSETDFLTGLLNRRGFDRAYLKERERLARNDKPFSVMLIDMDNFKSINDTHGHGEGDRILKLVADTLNRSTRTMDVACRYGGDEFAVLMPETRRADAVALQQRVEQDISRATDTFPYPVAASFGIHEARAEDSDPLGVADMNMYAAKKQKRVKNISSVATNLQSFLNDEQDRSPS